MFSEEKPLEEIQTELKFIDKLLSIITSYNSEVLDKLGEIAVLKKLNSDSAIEYIKKKREVLERMQKFIEHHYKRNAILRLLPENDKNPFLVSEDIEDIRLGLNMENSAAIENGFKSAVSRLTKAKETLEVHIKELTKSIESKRKK